MGGSCLLYLLLILLMRSGDVETNPGPNAAESSISEKEFLKLAQDIDPSYYYNVGISLGFSHAQLKANLIENLNNFNNAFMDVFMKWNVKQQPPHSNKRQLLAEKLREIELGGLSDGLLNEPPFPNSTGGPSKLFESQTKPLLAEYQTKPLSPELVELCANDFKFKYRSTVCKIRADPLNPASIVQFEDMHTNLVLQEKRGTEKRLLDYNDFLDLKVNGEFPKRIMVQGEAGAGKTTFCAKIAWDWIEGRHFSQFVWVLIVPLREFKRHTIGEIVKSYLAKNNPASVSQITEYIRSNPDKIFIAFDGLDEVSGNIMKITSCESQPTDQMQHQPSQPSATSPETDGSSSETADIGLEDILCSAQLASCPVLVTTRPWRAVEIRSNGDLMKLYTFIDVEGFNRENLSVYIHKYFPRNDDTAKQLIQFINDNDVISENMANYPIYVAMLCLMWKELDERKLKEIKSLTTFSQIFRVMIAFLKEHYAQKKVKNVGSHSLFAYLKQIDELLGPIAKQALSGLLENTLVFGEDDFEICPESKDTACRVGILSQEDRITNIMDIHKSSSHVQLPVFFPHKLFQEYMAGVHLASLYESDRNEFNRLIEQVVLPRNEEFRYLLYFTVSQNKTIATHVLNSMLQGKDINKGASEERTCMNKMYFIVDVAFESQDPDVAAFVKDRLPSDEITLTLRIRHMSPHTVAGYAFIRPHLTELHTSRDCGPTMSLDVAEIVCSMPSLEKASLQGTFHHCFFETIARKGKESKVQSLELNDLVCPTPASSHHLADALCSMPNLTDLTLGKNLNEEFYSTLKAKASFIQVKTLQLDAVKCPTPASSHHLAKALCSMPNLTYMTLQTNLNEGFCSTLKANASSIQVQTIVLDFLDFSTSASTHHLAEALCSMPKLTDLTLGCFLKFDMNITSKSQASSTKIQTLRPVHDKMSPVRVTSRYVATAGFVFKNRNNLTIQMEEFFSTLKAKASSIQVQTIRLEALDCPTPAAWSHLAGALCSMPNLTDLILGRSLDDGFYSSLKAIASSLQVRTLTLDVLQHLEQDASRYLAETLCSMPNLTDIKLGMYLRKEFYSTLKAKASSIQVQTLELDVRQCPAPASSHHLVEALSAMPNLTDLTLGMYFNNEFYSTLKAKASSIQVQTFKLVDDKSPTPASSHYLAEALGSMPDLTDLTLEMDPNEEFYSTLKAKASSIQVQTLKLDVLQFPTQVSSHHLAEALCSMPNLTDLTLGRNLNEEFYSTLSAKASSIQVQNLMLLDVKFQTSASSHHLAEALCSMPNLTDLTLLGRDIDEEFYSTWKSKASSIQLQGCFPQIRKGNFRFNGVAQDDLNSFLHGSTCLQSFHDSDSSNDSFVSANSGNSNDSPYNSDDLESSNDSDNLVDLGNPNDSDGSANSGNSHDAQLCSVV